MSQVHATWWGSAGFVLAFGETVVAIDPYLHPREGGVDYVLVTHDHYDHCHPPTLRGLTADPAFKRMLIPRSVPRLGELDSPISEEDGGAGLALAPAGSVTVVAPKYRRFPRATYDEPGEVALGRLLVETVDSSERPWRERPPGARTWPDGRGRFTGRDAYPNVGYVVTDRDSGVSVYHPGDLQEVFDAHRELRGRVDVLLLPHGKLVGMELSLVDAIRPRRVVPMHHRVEEPGFPIPLTVGPDDLACASFATGAPRTGASLADFRADQQRLIDGHWYPTPIPPLDRIRALEPELRALGAELLFLTAGQPARLA